MVKTASNQVGVSGKKGGEAVGPSMLKMLLIQTATYDNAKTLIFTIVVWKYLTRFLRHLRIYGITTSLYQIYTIFSRKVFTLILSTPAAKRKVEKELNIAMKEVEEKLVPRPSHIASNEKLPAYGRDSTWLLEELKKLQLMEAGGGDAIKIGTQGNEGSVNLSNGALKSSENANDWMNRDGQSVWQGGKMSGAVYHGGKEMSDLLAEAIKMFMLSNPLHPDAFPGVRRMESEVVSMVLKMYNAPSSGAGCTTSGGTESILMACKTMRTWAKAVKGINHPEMIVPVSAHAAFDKAGEYFGIKIHKVGVDLLTRKAKVRDMARAINKNTILLVCSAPNFPDGAIDDVPSIAALAAKANVGCHVDCCLGSFLVPFLEQAGLPSEPFDFRVEGVTSISCDTHKYGFAPKGSSVIMYRTSELRRHMYFVYAGWTGGVYASPTIAGSRPGSLIAGTWAAMISMGNNGYVDSCREIVGAARRIEKAIRSEIPQLRVLGKPLVSVVAFASAGKVSIYTVGDLMSQKGWHLNGLATEPPAIHIACTKLTVPVVDDFIRDLKESVKEAKVKGGKPGSMASLYGLGSGSSVGPALVGELAARFIDVLYKI